MSDPNNSIERYLHRLKSYVRNKACLERSIIEGYIMQEQVNFCSRYLNRVETRLNQVRRNLKGNDDIFHSRLQVFTRISKPLLARRYEKLSLMKWAQAI